jgi:hypothetical protein
VAPRTGRGADKAGSGIRREFAHAGRTGLAVHNSNPEHNETAQAREHRGLNVSPDLPDEPSTAEPGTKVVHRDLATSHAIVQ